MTFQETKEFAVKVIREEFAAFDFSITKIILFGSRSRGDAKPDSDWDFLVCISKDLTFPEKAKISTIIQRRLAEKFISADIIIRSEENLFKESKNVGVITYYALKDGVPV